MQTVISMIHHVQNNMPNTYAKKYDIQYQEAKRDKEYVWIEIAVNELFDPSKDAKIVGSILEKILRAKVVGCRIVKNEIIGNSLLKLETALIDTLVKADDSHHGAKRLRNFYRKYGAIKTVGYFPSIKYTENGTCQFISISENQEEQVKIEKPQRIRNFDFAYLKQVCMLYNQFESGAELFMDDKILLLSNLRTVEKGKEQFLKRECHSQIKWNTILAALKKNKIDRVKCDQCRYQDTCWHEKDMILTAKINWSRIVKRYEDSYVPLEEARNDLYRYTKEAIEANNNAIHIIKAQTALGKTNMMIQLIQEYKDRKFLIVVPTHQLKEQIYQDAKANGITNISTTPNIYTYDLPNDLMKRIEQYYHIGAGKRVHRFLQKELFKMSKSTDAYINIKRYLDDWKKAKKFQGSIITTHARFLYLDENQYEDYEIFIDEDMMRSLLATGSISIAELKNIRQTMKLPADVCKKIDELCQESDEHNVNYFQLSSLTFDDTTYEAITNIGNMKSDLLDLIQATYFACDGNQIYFLYEKPMPNRKVILFSATIDPMLYHRLYANREIKTSQCAKVAYMGNVIQHTDYTYSRFSFQEHKDLLPILQEKAKGKTVITFKEFEEKLNTTYHFGNIEGLNQLKGKNLMVIGLPNLNRIVYCLYGMRMGSVPQKDYDYMCPRKVEYLNYSFYLNTFEDSILQSIQLWLLSMQLEQAIGRARLLRYDCTVEVYARFPVEQAQFCIAEKRENHDIMDLNCLKSDTE